MKACWKVIPRCGCAWENTCSSNCVCRLWVSLLIDILRAHVNCHQNHYIVVHRAEHLLCVYRAFWRSFFQVHLWMAGQCCLKVCAMWTLKQLQLGIAVGNISCTLKLFYIVACQPSHCIVGDSWFVSVHSTWSECCVCLEVGNRVLHSRLWFLTRLIPWHHLHRYISLTFTLHHLSIPAHTHTLTKLPSL